VGINWFNHEVRNINIAKSKQALRIPNTLEVDFFQKNIYSPMLCNFRCFSYSEIRGKKIQIFSKILAIILICKIC